MTRTSTAVQAAVSNRPETTDATIVTHVARRLSDGTPWSTAAAQEVMC
ncbi:hypothetical protein [Natrinema sp. SYSU A 869]|nr:hypothetical protein [Natrinema sp. SYSU A 869]